MYGIELLLEEHQNIIRFTEVLRAYCKKLMKGAEVDVTFLRDCVAFGRNYADAHHHGKEEKILFKIMLDTMGPIAEKLVRNGMLVEHDLGRLHMGGLDTALTAWEEKPTDDIKLDIICHASGYADLLRRHIEKEDAVVYTFAERELSDERKEQVNQETKVFEEEETKNRIQDKYLSWLNKQMED